MTPCTVRYICCVALEHGCLSAASFAVPQTVLLPRELTLFILGELCRPCLSVASPGMWTSSKFKCSNSADEEPG